MPQPNARIKLLPQPVIEKIAAGEVIERPASVLKELVENSIDARSTRIDIRIEDAGFSLIAISDNGHGIVADDVLSAPVRYATSKISSADDLFSVTTMGFRGEALAAVSAVSRTTIESSATTDGLGYRLDIEGGVSGTLVPVARTQGTSITVRDLFFNVPARKKFMKSSRSEQMAIMRLVEQLVVPFPDVQFTLTLEGRVVLDAPRTHTVQERVSQIGGHEFTRDLIECTSERPGMGMRLLVSRPAQAAARPRFQNLYVNLRRVDNDSVSAAIRQGYSRFIAEFLRPSFFCFLDIDPTRVDVNVHPTKKTIRFDDDKSIFSFVYGAVQRGLTEHVGTSAAVHAVPQAPGAGHEGVFVPPVYEMRRERPVAGVRETGQVPTVVTAGIPAGGDADAAQAPMHLSNIPAASEKDLDPTSASTLQFPEQVDDEPWTLISCYQIHGSYILAPIKNGILLIDQHAAHERILYEQALSDMDRGSSESQQLLFPVVMELSPAERAIVDGARKQFRALGFDVQDFGGQSVSISAMPGFMKHSSGEQAIRQMLEYLMSDGNARMPDPRHRFAAAFACGSAIKAGQKLDQEEMNALLNSLFAAQNPYTCPHGRPTIIRMSLDELARRFLR
jgi:DNA mismatch repair protein MutL